MRLETSFAVSSQWAPSTRQRSSGLIQLEGANKGSGAGEWQNQSSLCEKTCLAALWIGAGLRRSVPNGVQVTLDR